MFGNSGNKNLTEESKFEPCGHMQLQIICILVTKNYRESYNIHAANGILFNQKAITR